MPIAYGNVVATLLNFEGEDPTGYAVLTPEVIQVNVPGDVIIVPANVTVELVGGNLPSTQLVASVQEGGQPDSFQWTVHWYLNNSTSGPAPVTFTLLADETLDLSTVISEEPNPGTVHYLDLSNLVEAQEAAADAEASAADAETARAAAANQASNAEQSANDAEAALNAMPRWWFGTQVAYNAIPVKDPQTLYAITG